MGLKTGGSVIPIYTKKNRQNTQKYPKFIQMYVKLMEALYTVYLKFKESDKPNTRLLTAIYRIPDLKSPCIPYTQKPWPTLTYDTRHLQHVRIAVWQLFFFFARPKSFRKKPARRREIFADIKTMLFYSTKRKQTSSSRVVFRSILVASSKFPFCNF